MKKEMVESTLVEILSLPLVDIINLLLERNATSMTFVIPVDNKEGSKIKISIKRVKVH